MTTRLNLSSRPFRNRALPWTVTAVVTLVSIIALIFIVKSTFQTNAQAQAMQKDVANLKSQTDAISRRAQEIKINLTADQERALKSTHSLVDRKMFSWSRLFADLESVLPGTVKVSRIAVNQVGLSGDRMVANLALTVVSKSPTNVTQMIDDMQRGGIFRATLRSQNLQRGRDEVGAEYEMDLNYTQSASAPVSESERDTRPVDTASTNRSKHQ